ncbi:hypothetical protein GCM10011515_23690 [Tsuneonella deserti]|uniref:Outer membrane efflux protein BepC n=1 Tax=Tsuneonella deserti TaxID=2035528 RepID=A0ABQ1S9X7_9SPHN|nr:TolC family protein [Tsuneonella deserti]GGE03326.1 hypothetical protein GCM10011515_23690 [Tsuneonella deserti]
MISRFYLCIPAISVFLLIRPSAAEAQEDPSGSRPVIETQGVSFSVPNTATSGIDYNTPVTTLTDAIERSYLTDPALMAERSRTRASEYRLVEANGAFGPRADYQLRYGYQWDRADIVSDLFITRSGWSAAASVALSQPIFTFGRLTADRRQAEALLKLQSALAREAEQETVFQVISAYIGVLRDRNALQISEDNRAILGQQFEDTKSRYLAREATVTDLRQVETRMEFAQAQTSIAKGALAATEADFRASTGSPAGDLAPPNPLVVPPRTLEDALRIAENDNPLLAAANAREQASRAVAAGAAAARAPRVDFRGQADLNPVSPYSNERRQTGLSGQVVVSAPLFDGGVLAARVEQARAANDADWHLVDRTRRELAAELNQSWAAWISQEKALADLSAAVDAAQSAYQGALEQQRAGFVTTLDALTLARELLTARSTLNTLQADTYISRARTLRALGLLRVSFLLPDFRNGSAPGHRNGPPLWGVLNPLTPLFRQFDALFPPPVSPRQSRDVTDPLDPASIRTQGEFAERPAD